MNMKREGFSNAIYNFNLENNESILNIIHDKKHNYNFKALVKA
jgi:hypothetical protein